MISAGNGFASASGAASFAGVSNNDRFERSMDLWIVFWARLVSFSRIRLSGDKLFLRFSEELCSADRLIRAASLVGSGELLLPFSALAYGGVYFGFSTTAGSFIVFATSFVTAGAGVYLTGSGPFAELLLVSSSEPWANRHLSPYLQLPFSRQFLHISYLRRLTTGWGAAVTVEVEPCDEVLSELELFNDAAWFTATTVLFWLSDDELLQLEALPPDESDCDDGFPKLCSPRGCRLSLVSVLVVVAGFVGDAFFCLTW